MAPSPSIWNKLQKRLQRHPATIDEIELVPLDDPTPVLPPAVPALTRRYLQQRWPELLDLLTDVRPTYVAELAKLRDRLYVSNQRVSIYVGDLSIGEELVDACRDSLQQAIAATFGDAVRLEFELDQISIGYEDVDINSGTPPSPTEAGIIEMMIEPELESDPEIATLQQEISDLEAELRTRKDQVQDGTWQPNNLKRIIEICCLLGQRVEKLEKMPGRGSDRARLLYLEAISYGRTLYRVPVWRETVLDVLTAHLPRLFVAELALTSSGQFSLIRSFSYHTEDRLLLDYLKGEYRRQLGDVVYVDRTDMRETTFQGIRQESLKTWSERGKPVPYFLILGRPLLRSETRLAWQIVRDLNDSGARPAILLEEEILLHWLLSDDRLDEKVNGLLYRWLDHPPTFFESKVVHGFDFYGRQADVRRLSKMIEDGESFHVVGLRRSGKTSLLNFVLEHQFADRPVAMVDARYARNGCTRLGYMLAKALYDDAVRKFPDNELANLDPIYKQPGYSLDDFAADVMAMAKKLPSEHLTRLVLVVDEIEHILPVGDKGLVDWWDFLMTTHGLTEDWPIVFITLARLPVMARSQIDGKYNPFCGKRRELFPPMQSDDCSSLIEDLGLPLEISFAAQGTLDRILTETGGHVYMVRALCDAIAKEYSDRPLQVTPQMVEYVARKVALENQFVEDITEELTAIEEEILDRIVISTEPVLPREVLGDYSNHEQSLSARRALTNLYHLGLLNQTEHGAFTLRINMLATKRRPAAVFSAIGAT